MHQVYIIISFFLKKKNNDAFFYIITRKYLSLLSVFSMSKLSQKHVAN